MTTIRNASQRLKVNNLTVIQQSYCLQEGRISESQLLHPIVAKLYPYFSLVYGNLLQWVSERHYTNSSLKVSAFFMDYIYIYINQFLIFLCYLFNIYIYRNSIG